MPTCVLQMVLRKRSSLYVVLPRIINTLRVVGVDFVIRSSLYVYLLRVSRKMGFLEQLSRDVSCKKNRER